MSILNWIGFIMLIVPLIAMAAVLAWFVLAADGAKEDLYGTVGIIWVIAGILFMLM